MLQQIPNDSAARKKAMRDMLWKDHGILRTFWTNFGQVAPDVYRSNHPPHKRLEQYRDRGIKSILNLRGTPNLPHHQFEVESCNELGLNLVSVALHARMPARIDQLSALFDAFDTIERPFVMHCKSGADRAGLAAALYRLDQGEPVSAVRTELSFRYLHLSFTKTGVQDHMLELFEQRQSVGHIGIREWLLAEYDPVALADSFAKKRILAL